MIARLIVAVAALILAACSGALGPSADELQKKFAAGLPSIWKLNSFKVTTEENTGTKTQPDIRSRFVAHVELAQDLYSPVGQIGQTAVLSKTGKVGDMKTELHGVARSQPNAGQWATLFDLENTARVNLSAKPLAAYGIYVIAGSAEEKDLRAKAEKQQEEALRVAKEKVDRERQQLEADEKAVLSLLKPGRRIPGRFLPADHVTPVVIEITALDPVTKTFQGTNSYTFESESRVFRIQGVYQGKRVRMQHQMPPLRGNDYANCLFDLVATGSVPEFTGTFARCSSGKMELGLK